jgi:hypothetical protein
MGEHELEELMLYMVLMAPTILFASVVFCAIYNAK